MIEHRDSPGFLWRCWADGAVIFDRQYGNTHGLNRLTAEVFRVWLEAPSLDHPAICQRLAADFAEIVDLPLAVAQARAQLEAHGLLR